MGGMCVSLFPQNRDSHDTSNLTMKWTKTNRDRSRRRHKCEIMVLSKFLCTRVRDNSYPKNWRNLTFFLGSIFLFFVRPSYFFWGSPSYFFFGVHLTFLLETFLLFWWSPSSLFFGFHLTFFLVKILRQIFENLERQKLQR